MKDYKIGEIVRLFGKNTIVKEELKCDGCFLFSSLFSCENYACNPGQRKDRKGIIFKKIIRDK